MNCVATVEQRERGTDEMVAPVQVPVSPELNCGVFTAYLQVSLLQVSSEGQLIMVLECIGMSEMKHVHDPT